MSTPAALCASACFGAPHSAATSRPLSWISSMISAGGVPSAFAISLTFGCESATSPCGRAVASVQPSSSCIFSSSGTSGTPWSARIFCTKSRWPCGIIALRSASSFSASSTPMPSYLPGITMSTPYGLSPTCSSIHASSTSSCSGVKPTAPSTPKPPAFDTAATTSRQCVKAKMGNSMPRRLASSVCMMIPLVVANGLPKCDRDVLEAVDEVGAQAARLAGQLGVRVAPQQLAQHRLDLEPGQVGPEAEVHAAPAEGDVV